MLFFSWLNIDDIVINIIITNWIDLSDENLISTLYNKLKKNQKSVLNSLPSVFPTRCWHIGIIMILDKAQWLSEKEFTSRKLLAIGID